MADHKTYLAYKRDTIYLLYWMTHAYNEIVKSSSSGGGDGPLTLNTTDQVTVSGMVAISELIAKHISPIPSTVYKIFESCIAARKVRTKNFL